MSDPIPTESLRFAFGYQMARRIVTADGAIGPAEQAFLDRHFPASDFVAYGFRDAHGVPTERWDEALGDALMEIPAHPESERLELLTQLWTAAMADAELHPDETKSIQHAARLLGLPADTVAAHLGSLRP